MEKKRELLPILTDGIVSLIELYDDCKTLETTDNELASRRLRNNIIAFKNTDLKKLELVVANIRYEINVEKGRVTKKVPKEFKEQTLKKRVPSKPINNNLNKNKL